MISYNINEYHIIHNIPRSQWFQASRKNSVFFVTHVHQTLGAVETAKERFAILLKPGVWGNPGAIDGSVSGRSQRSSQRGGRWNLFHDFMEVFFVDQNAWGNWRKTHAHTHTHRCQSSRTEHLIFCGLFVECKTPKQDAFKTCMLSVPIPSSETIENSSILEASLRPHLGIS